MFKKNQALVTGVLSMGLLLGSGSLISPSIVSAASISNNQPTIAYHSFTGSQQKAPQPGNDPAIRSLYRQSDQRSYQSYDSIVNQAANLIGVSNRTVVNGLNHGYTLVQIARNHGISSSSTLTRLKYLQQKIDQSYEGSIYDNQHKALYNWNSSK